MGKEEGERKRKEGREWRGKWEAREKGEKKKGGE